MLFNRAVGIHVMQVTVMKVIDVIFVFYCRVPAIWAMLMIVVFVSVGHQIVPFGNGGEFTMKRCAGKSLCRHSQW
jgi:hypothetical protein